MPALDAVRTGLAALAPVTGRPTPRATPGERTGAATFAAPMTTPPRAPRTSADAPAGPSWADLLARRGEAALNLESSVADVDRTALPDAAPRRDAPSVAQRKAVHRTALDLQDIASNVQRARAVGVEPAKANFWRRFAGAAFTGVLALASAGIAVLSGGAVLAIGAAAVMISESALGRAAGAGSAAKIAPVTKSETKPKTRRRLRPPVKELGVLLAMRRSIPHGHAGASLVPRSPRSSPARRQWRTARIPAGPRRRGRSRARRPVRTSTPRPRTRRSPAPDIRSLPRSAR